MNHLNEHAVERASKSRAALSQLDYTGPMITEWSVQVSTLYTVCALTSNATNVDDRGDKLPKFLEPTNAQLLQMLNLGCGWKVKWGLRSKLWMEPRLISDISYAQKREITFLRVKKKVPFSIPVNSVASVWSHSGDIQWLDLKMRHWEVKLYKLLSKCFLGFFFN